MDSVHCARSVHDSGTLSVCAAETQGEVCVLQMTSISLIALTEHDVYRLLDIPVAEMASHIIIHAMTLLLLTSSRHC